LTSRAGLAGTLSLLASLAVLAGTARAGTWVQVSCVNPNGSASNAFGWSGATSGPYATGATTSASSCGPGNPLVAAQDVIFGTPPSYGSTATLTYTPPDGSRLAGGTALVSLEAYAYGSPSTPAFTIAYVGAPDASNRLQAVACGGQPNCSSNTFSGLVSIPADGGVFLATVACSDLVQTTDQCDQGGQDGVYDRARVYAADFELSTNAQPQATGFHGSALQRNASGKARLVFTATDPVGAGQNPPSGPGVFAATVKIDGRAVHTGTPNTNGGACVPVGGGAGQPLMFDSQQPCPPAETVDVPVPTRRLPDGRHRLALIVSDAAGDAATVLDQYISTFNPQITPAPRGPRRVRARFVLSWHWSGRHTTLRSVTVRRLPGDARMAISCHGQGCPPGVATVSSGSGAVKRALSGLHDLRFRAGDRVVITVTAPGRRSDRILIRIRNGRIPAAALLGG
jgi:hypothetical protein